MSQFRPSYVNQSLCVSDLLPAASKTVRSPRPPYVFLRVGEVVVETKGHMVGVVVSWDPELRAPPEWIDRVYSTSEVSSSCVSILEAGCNTAVVSPLTCTHAGPEGREHPPL